MLIYPTSLFDISDHYPVLCELDLVRNTPPPDYILRRDRSNLSKENLQLDAYNKFSSNFVNVSNTANSTLLNQEFNSFVQDVKTLIDAHAPLQRVTRRKQKLHLKPWLTPDILRAIKTRNALHRKFIKSKATCQGTA